jgi:hypothetical protein
MITFSVNWFAIVVSIVINMVIGAVWFGIFTNPWLDSIGKTRQEIQSSQSWRAYLVAILNSFLMAFVLANVIDWAGISSLFSGLLTGLLMWVGFTGFTFASNHAFEERSLKLWVVNSGSYLVGLLVIGAILGGWQ